jgi:glycosyltransferase involved in cell wall biosynthesis
MPLKRLYVLASHEPNLDPRIDWVCRFAAGMFQVTVFGVTDTSGLKPAYDYRHGYEIKRLPALYRGWLRFTAAAGRRFYTSRLLWVPLLLCLPLSVFLVPLLVGKVIRAIYIKTLPAPALEAIRELKRSVLKRCRLCSLMESGFERCYYQVSRNWHIFRRFILTAITHYQALRAAPRPDLIYCNDLDTVLAGTILKFRFGCKLIYDAHEFWAHADPESPRWEVRSFLFYERKLLRHVDAAFTVNHLLAQQMEAASGFPVASLPNCEPIFAAAKSDAGLTVRSRTGGQEPDRMSGDRVRFLFQGNFAPERGIHELLQLWRRVDPRKAVLFLRGPDNPDRRRCLELAQRLGVLDQSVYFPEPVREYELIAAASEADVGVIPYKACTINYRFACPNKLSQYMQAGLAILANNLDFVRFVVERYGCGLTYDVNNEDSVLAAIHRLIDDEAFRRACGERAKEAAITEFNWETLSRPLYDTCARLVGLELAGPSSATPLSRVA